MIVSETNDFRAAHDRKTVNLDRRLTGTAQDFADFMARTGHYGHTADGKRPAERVKLHGYEYCIVAENIAYAYRSSGFSAQVLTDTLVQGWIQSAPHRENLLDEGVTEIGAGVARSAKTGYYYAVQDFARPLSAAIRFSVANHGSRPIHYRLGDRSYALAPAATRTHAACRPVELQFSATRRGAPPGSGTFRPANGDRFIATQAGRKLAVEKR